MSYILVARRVIASGYIIDIIVRSISNENT